MRVSRRFWARNSGMRITQLSSESGPRFDLMLCPPKAPFFDLEKMMAEQAAIQAKIEAVNRAEVERERLMKEQEEMAMEAEKMLAEEVAKEVLNPDFD